MGNRIAMAVPIFLVVGGCLGANPQATAGVDVAFHVAAAPTPGSFGLADCDTFHLVFPSPAPPFQTFVPKGFQIKTEDAAGTVVNTVAVASSCQAVWLGSAANRSLAKASVGEYLVLLPVIPPGNLRNASYSADYAPVAIYTTNKAIQGFYEASGLKPTKEQTSITLTTPQNNMAFRVDSFGVVAGPETYGHTIEIAKQDGAFAKGLSRTWGVRDGDAVGFMRYAWAESRSVGLGTVEFSYKGPGGAPPLHQGVAHLVVGGAAEYSYETLGTPV